jgi:hypothetical protein
MAFALLNTLVTGCIPDLGGPVNADVFPVPLHHDVDDYAPEVALFSIQEMRTKGLEALARSPLKAEFEVQVHLQHSVNIYKRAKTSFSCLCILHYIEETINLDVM